MANEKTARKSTTWKGGKESSKPKTFCIRELRVGGTKGFRKRSGKKTEEENKNEVTSRKNSGWQGGVGGKHRS